MALLRAQLGPTLRGAYLHGSSTAGGLRPASDVDVLVVTGRSLTQQQRTGLVSGLLELSGPGAGGRSLEVTVVEATQLRPWRYPPVVDLVYGDWLRDELASGTGEPAPMTSLAIEAHQARAADHRLLGPPAADLLDPVPVADLVRASTDGLPALLADLPHDTRNVLLTLARAWYTCVHHAVVPKDVAAAWALDRLPAEHGPVLAHARHLYLHTTYADETWPPGLQERAAAAADRMVAGIG